MVEGGQKDDAALKHFRLQPTRRLQQRNLSLVLVPMASGGEEQGRSFTTGYRGDGNLDRTPGRLVAGVGNRQKALMLAGRVQGNGDRKSTRLNSSHVAISYAVFCL